MYAVIVNFTLKPGMIDKFLPHMVKNARTSLQEEPNCGQFDICLGNEPDTVVLYEIYQDADAFEAHLETDHYLNFDLAVANMIATKTVHRFKQVIR